jgi:hypothetical protein
MIEQQYHRCLNWLRLYRCWAAMLLTDWMMFTG